MAGKKVYAVAKGRRTGVFDKWFGPGGAHEQIDGFPKAVFKGFPSREAAEEWLAKRGSDSAPPVKKTAPPAHGTAPGRIVIYTDGGSVNNPGPGGYGVVMLTEEGRRELSGGFRLTTNNRMELTACIVALRALTRPASVLLHSDSKYVVDGISKGWARRWRARNWMRTPSEKAKNADLWADLLDLCERHDVQFQWVKGHAGVPENERCDQLVNQEQRKSGLPPDAVYEKEAAQT